MLCSSRPQHPPEMVPLMLSSLSSRTPFTLGTRYGPGVSMDDSWPLYRRVISNGARYMALPLTGVSDPMSGFFGIRKEEVRPYLLPPDNGSAS